MKKGARDRESRRQAWFRDRIQSRTAPTEQLSAAFEYLQATLKRLPEEDADRAAQTICRDLIATTESLASNKTKVA
ncbi:hypothetical protein GCM10009765_66380 [Fodinicola feengrottensis]|uniref:Uncharacterized protein n=2 Tax=Fodinicola feengrottensis TaxID=435914 RepID=A0ABN2IMM4_9ACTN